MSRQDALSLRAPGSILDTSGSAKTATKVANRMLEDISAIGWPIGEVVGSETELLEQYGVSRTVFREAVRLLENQQVAYMRRGLHGGLVVMEPTVDAISDAVAFYLYRVDARLAELFEARMVLDEMAVSLALQRHDELDDERFRECLTGSPSDQRAIESSFHSVLASAAKNPALSLFIEILNRVSELFFLESGEASAQAAESARTAHERIFDSIMRGDEDSARSGMRDHIRSEAQFLQRRRSSRKVLNPIAAGRGPATDKLAEDVARGIFQNVVAARLSPGQPIGSEAQLVERYGVSRAVIRQAVRVLEHHQVATMRRGPGGGLFAVAPSARATCDAVAIYLERQGINAAQLFELRAGIELSIVDLVIDNLTDEHRSILLRALEEEASSSLDDFSVSAHDLHIVLGSLSANRILELIQAVLVQLSHIHEMKVADESARRFVVGDVNRTHGRIVDAIVSSEGALARRRMARHLESLSEHFA
jgi:DNA-binding FadR family transcriptional regulator